MNNLVTITEAANTHLSSIIKDNKVKGVALGVKGGGCAGFSYEWNLLNTIPDEFNTEDKIKLHAGLLCVQPEAVMYILDSVLDYTNDIAGSYLKFINPNATSQCGCGESFAV